MKPKEKLHPWQDTVLKYMLGGIKTGEMTIIACKSGTGKSLIKQKQSKQETLKF